MLTSSSSSSSSLSPSSLEVLTLTTLGAAVGALLTFWIQHVYAENFSPKNREGPEYLPVEAERRRRLPSLVILVRHGESEGNVDQKRWWTTPDNLIRLTPTGVLQAEEAGRRIERILRTYEQTHGVPMDRVHIHASPFERTMETACHARRAFERRVVRHNVCPRLREQEFGNTQGESFDAHRREQRRVGRFWYRFPTGESGADVYDRVKSWWDDTLLSSNERYGYEPVHAVVVFSHGLALRFVLMQLFSWSPTTFHSVYNVHNCDLYVLRRDLQKPGSSPYVLDVQNGDAPRSSIDILVTLRDRQGAVTTAATPAPAATQDQDAATMAKTTGTTRKVFKLDDYLSIPPPRMTHIDEVKRKLASQYPNEIDIDRIEHVAFMPFYHADGSSSVVADSAAAVQSRTSTAIGNLEEIGRDGHWKRQAKQGCAKPESSNRWPVCDSA